MPHRSSTSPVNRNVHIFIKAISGAVHAEFIKPFLTRNAQDALRIKTAASARSRKVLSGI